jgi:mono/diheme cytochrome c family protein
MKKALRIILIIVTVVVLAVAGILSYVKFSLPGANVKEAENLKIEYTPERIERGKYLANNVSACMDCHSKRDYNTFGAPMVAGTLGQGGELFGTAMGFPGNYYAPNITPYGIGTWTDGELVRAITTGVSKDGHALFPVMPYANFGKLDKEDIYSIVAYVRTLKSIENDVPKSSPDFPMNFIINTIPHEAAFTSIPDTSDLIAYGKYVFTAAGCNECHTPQEKGQPVEGKYLAGGFEFPFPDGSVVRSLNITPDKQTGIGNWTEEQFVNRFKLYSDSTYVLTSVKPNEFKTIMPWLFYTHMKDTDLKAIYAYLQTVPPVENKVTKFDAHYVVD